MDYTIEQLKKPEDFTEDVLQFIKEESPKIAKLFGMEYDPDNCPARKFAEKGLFLICRRNREIRGMIVAYLCTSPFNPAIRRLQQQLFYVKPDSGRTAFYLFKKFIDIGKTEADYITTMLSSQTNIKPETLQKLGFKQTEVLYTLEVNNGTIRK